MIHIAFRNVIYPWGSTYLDGSGIAKRFVEVISLVLEL